MLQAEEKENGEFLLCPEIAVTEEVMDLYNGLEPESSRSAKVNNLP